MNRIRTTAVAVLSTAALTLTISPSVAHAAASDKEPCATRQAQVDKAEAALARVTAVFAKQEQHVADAREDVADADTRAEKAKAKQHLADAKEKKAHVAKAKKAQQMRLAKASQRLEACQAAHPA